MNSSRICGFAVFGSLVLVASSRAGMAAPTLADLPTARSLDDVARLRFDVISFFALGFLVCAKVIQWLWNSLRKDFPRLPRLSYRRAMSVVGLWGLLFLLVLTMISGARELMTPGAWEKVGATYRLAPLPSQVELEIHARSESIERFQKELWAYGETHDRTFPTVETVASSPSQWSGSSKGPFVYLGGRMRPDTFDHDSLGNPTQPRLLAVEPDGFGADRMALYRNGDIRWVRAEEVRTMSQPEKR